MKSCEIHAGPGAVLFNYPFIKGRWGWNIHRLVGAHDPKRGVHLLSRKFHVNPTSAPWEKTSFTIKRCWSMMNHSKMQGFKEMVPHMGIPRHSDDK